VAEERKKIRPRGGKSCILRADWDRAIATIAEGQAGRVSRRQLVDLGISDEAIAVRVSSGRLIRLRNGVFALGHRRDDRARHWAAVLAVGDDGAISHLSGAAEHRMVRTAPLTVDVTTPRRLPRREGIRVHSRRLDAEALCSVAGLPVTSPSQTLFDLASVLEQGALARAANEAFVRQLVSHDDLLAALARKSRRNGAAWFRRLLGRLGIAGRVRSPLEVRLHRFLDARGFPPWESNVRLRIGGEWIEPDVLWREQRVIVEADGRGPHLAPLTFASDRRRDRRVRVEGWEPVRVTEDDLDLRPDELESDLRAILGAARRQ
jgi:predicted transcriptional regulator of viral defense system/very-short-patch-repair endonuclease